MATAHSTIGRSLCRRCSALLELNDRYCRHCGRSTSADVADDEPPKRELAWPEAQTAHVRLCDRRWFVLVMLFFVLGPLALPMLWTSRAFTPIAKTTLTVLGLVTTLLVLFAGMLPLEHLLAPLHEAIPHSNAVFGP